MNKIFFCTLLIAIGFAASCDSGDDAPAGTVSLNSSWKLTHVSGSITGASYDIPDGTIRWVFNTQAGNVTVINNNPADVEDFFATGVYDMVLEPNEVTPQTCNEVVLINNISFGCVGIDGNTLTLSQVESDGYTLTFQK